MSDTGSTSFTVENSESGYDHPDEAAMLSSMGPISPQPAVVRHYSPDANCDADGYETYYPRPNNFLEVQLERELKESLSKMGSGQVGHSYEELDYHGNTIFSTTGKSGLATGNQPASNNQPCQPRQPIKERVTRVTEPVINPLASDCPKTEQSRPHTQMVRVIEPEKVVIRHRRKLRITPNADVQREPCEPQKPVVQQKPCEPQKPVVQQKPCEPQKPVVQQKPCEPQKPVVQQKPYEPQKPFVQQKPCEPQKPVVPPAQTGHMAGARLSNGRKGSIKGDRGGEVPVSPKIQPIVIRQGNSDRRPSTARQVQESPKMQVPYQPAATTRKRPEKPKRMKTQLEALKPSSKLTDEMLQPLAFEDDYPDQCYYETVKYVCERGTTADDGGLFIKMGIQPNVVRRDNVNGVDIHRDDMVHVTGRVVPVHRVQIWSCDALVDIFTLQNKNGDNRYIRMSSGEGCLSEIEFGPLSVSMEPPLDNILQKVDNKRLEPVLIRKAFGAIRRVVFQVAEVTINELKGVVAWSLCLDQGYAKKTKAKKFKTLGTRYPEPPYAKNVAPYYQLGWFGKAQVAKVKIEFNMLPIARALGTRQEVKMCKRTEQDRGSVPKNTDEDMSRRK